MEIPHMKHYQSDFSAQEEAININNTAPVQMENTVFFRHEQEQHLI